MKLLAFIGRILIDLPFAMSGFGKTAPTALEGLQHHIFKGRSLLAGIFQMLGYLAADRQLNISVDAHIDDHRAVFDGERLVDLAEIIGPIDPEGGHRLRAARDA